MKATVKFSIATAMIFSLTACNSWVMGKKDDRELKNHASHWGVPKIRPTTWGFTGIDRDCRTQECSKSDTK